MSEAATHGNEQAHDHEEHLEVWPDAGITETAKPLPWWLFLVACGFALGMFNAYWNQFVEHAVEFPKYGHGYPYLSEEQQYPGKINPTITTQGEVTFTLGKEGALMLEASGGRGGKSWRITEGELPPGIVLRQTGETNAADGAATQSGMALTGTPTKAGEYSVTVRCDSGSGYAEKQIIINVEQK